MHSSVLMAFKVTSKVFSFRVDAAKRVIYAVYIALNKIKKNPEKEVNLFFSFWKFTCFA